MKKSLVVSFAFTVIASTIIILACSYSSMPNGWFVAGSNPAGYEMGIDNSVSQNGNSNAFIESKTVKEYQFGTLMQTITAENYLGKRLQLSGYMKTKDVKGWSGFWMRIDGDNYQTLGFDNMQMRPIKGTTNWNRYEIVLDIPSNSKTINYGALLAGEGKIWFDNIVIKEVDKNIPLTNIMKEHKLSNAPINLDFEDK